MSGGSRRDGRRARVLMAYYGTAGAPRSPMTPDKPGMLTERHDNAQDGKPEAVLGSALWEQGSGDGCSTRPLRPGPEEAPQSVAGLPSAPVTTAVPVRISCQ